MTALELYQEDLQQRSEPYKRRSRMEYFAQLRDTLQAELMEQGRSDFLEQMIARCEAGESLTALEFSALRECYASIVDGHRLKDFTLHAPHLLRGENRPVSWQELEAGPAFRVKDPQMQEMLVRLRNISWQLVSARDQTPAVEAERAISFEITGLRAVNHALEDRNRELLEERDELKARVAELEEGVISRHLQHRLDARRYQMEAELQREMADKRRAAEAEVRKIFADAADAQQQAREESRRDAAGADAQRAAGYEVLQAEMKTALVRQMETLVRGMRSADYRFLAQCFTTLKGAADRELRTLLSDAPGHGADETLLRRLTDADMALHMQLSRMEQALMQLGLQMYQPQPGEPFDPALHSPASASGDDVPVSEREIAAVETPGMRLVHADRSGEVLVRAVVHTRRRPIPEDEDLTDGAPQE